MKGDLAMYEYDVPKRKSVSIGFNHIDVITIAIILLAFVWLKRQERTAQPSPQEQEFIAK
jgi:hypothetical protein